MKDRERHLSLEAAVVGVALGVTAYLGLRRSRQGGLTDAEALQRFQEYRQNYRIKELRPSTPAK